MAGSKCAYLAQKELDALLGVTAYTPPANLYVALSTAAFDPSATGSAMTEVVAADYARVEIANSSATWSAATAASPSEKHNLADILFTTATSDWGTPLSVYLCDAATAGNALYGADISNAQDVQSGDTAKIKASALIVNES